jgi:hypothetical protein
MRSAFLACVLVGLSLFTSSLTAQVQPANVTRPGYRPASAAVSSPAPPQALTECEANQCETAGAGGAVWIFEGNRGQAMWRFGPVASLSIDKFDGHTIVISRTDPPNSASSGFAPGGQFRAVYSGTIHGNRIDGTVVWNGDTSHSGTWYAAIPQKLCVPFADCPLTMQQMLDLGGNTYQAGLHLAGERCFRVAAEQGDTDGEAYLGFVLYQDKGNPARAAEAFKWATKSAAGNNGLGEILLGHIYQHGVGTAPNAELAQSWLDKGHAKMKQDEAAQVQQQVRQVIGQAAVETVLGLMLSAATGDTSGGDPAWEREKRTTEDYFQQMDHIRVMEHDHPSPQD